MTASTDPQRWRRLSALFDRAIDLDAAARRALIDAECAHDPALRDALDRMLAVDADAADALDGGAARLVTDVDLWPSDPAHAADDDAAAIGDLLGHWRVERVLGRGGMGTVYAAHRADPRDGDVGRQRAAVKRLHRRWDGSGQAQRFLQERRILAALSHPHIPRLIDHGLDGDGRPWFALELIEGRDLLADADLRRLGLRERIVLFRAVCDAVQHAHEHFVVHRDLKPANVLVDEDGHPRVLDFGVAKRIDETAGATRTGAFAGFTPDYAAPEQISGGPVSAATDVYALGVILYQLLSARLPYVIDRDDLRAAAEIITTRAADRLDLAITTGAPHDIDERLQQRGTDRRAFRRFVRGDLSRIVQTALAKEPSRRYASVQAFSGDLERFLEGRTVSVSGDTLAYRARKFIQRNRWSVAMGAVAVLALAFGVSGIALKTRDAQAQAARATAEAGRAAREAARAEMQATRAKLEADRLSAANEFLRSVFSQAAPGNGATPNITLAQALDNAVAALEPMEGRDAQLHVRFLLAASASYEALGDTGKAIAAVEDAQRIQRRFLPASKPDRALVLANLAWQHLNDRPKDSLAWAQEALALQRDDPSASPSGLLEAYSILGSAQYTTGDLDGAIATNRAARRYMHDVGYPEDGNDAITLLSNEALMLAGQSRFAEAATAHEQAVALRVRTLGASAVGTFTERVYYANTLNRAARHDASLAQVDAALPGLRRELGESHGSVQQALAIRGRALLGLHRDADAAATLAGVHAYGRTHDFEARQGEVAGFYAMALARLGRCGEAEAVLADIATRAIVLPQSLSTPLSGTRCAATPR